MTHAEDLYDKNFSFINFLLQEYKERKRKERKLKR